jgi:hypothetical protein
MFIAGEIAAELGRRSMPMKPANNNAFHRSAQARRR